MVGQKQAETQKQSKKSAVKQSVEKQTPKLLSKQSTAYAAVHGAVTATQPIGLADATILQRSIGNQALGQIASRIQRSPINDEPTLDTISAPQPSTASAGTMKREQFEETMQQRFNVARIYTGTFDEQVGRLNRLRLPGDRLNMASWASWDPGSSSSVYQWIVSAFADFANTFGGVPAVQAIGFYETDYVQNSTGDLI